MGATVQQKSKPCLTVSQMCISLHGGGVGISVTSQQEGSCCHSQRCGQLLIAELNAEHGTEVNMECMFLCRTLGNIRGRTETWDNKGRQ